MHFSQPTPSCQVTCLRNNSLGNIHPVFIHQIIGCLQLSPLWQSTSRLCCLLDTTSTRPAFTSTSAASGCSMKRRRGRSSVTLFVSTKRTEDFHSQVNCTSKIVLAKWTSDFHSQVKSTQDVLASAPPTFTRKSTALPRLCLPNGL